jgi:hypothetical protein
MVGYLMPGKFLGARHRRGNDRVLTTRWTTKPHGEAGLCAHAFVSPAMPAAPVAVQNFDGSYGTGVSNGTIGRPMGRGGGAD